MKSPQIKLLALAGSLGFLAATPALARVTLAVKGGAIVPVAGDFHNSASAGGVSIEGKDISDFYKSFGTIGLEAIGHTGDKGQIFAGFAYETGDADRDSVGTLNGADLRAEFEDYEAFSFYGGARYYFAGSEGSSPFIGAKLGYKHANEIDARLTAPDANFDSGFVPFYDDSDIFFATVDVGLTFEFRSGWSVTGEIGVQYQTAFEDTDSAVNQIGVPKLNDGDGFFSIPVTIAVGRDF